MPIYEYGCHKCRKFVEIIVRRVTDDFTPRCPECGGRKLTRMVSNFSFHLSMKSRVDQLDPKYDKMIDASNPDLSFDSLVQRYKLDQPMVTERMKKRVRESGESFIPEEPSRPQRAVDVQ